VSAGAPPPPKPPHDDPEALLDAFLAALDERDPARAAAAAWPLLGGRPAREVGDADGLARLFRNERHEPLLDASQRTRVAWDRRERAARAELLVVPASGEAPHAWLVSLALGADGRWTLTGLQREGFEV
jgi:hypothetical protein